MLIPAIIGIAALAAGVTEAVVVVTPLEVIKIRLQAQKLGNSGETLVKGRTLALFHAFQREGFGSLYSGMGLTALRQGTNQAGMGTCISLVKIGEYY